MITDTQKELITRFPLGFVASVTPDGAPRVSPKGTFIVLDDTTLAFGDIRSPGTVSNLRANPLCEMNFVDPFLRKGVRLRARACIHAKGDARFEQLIDQWHDTWGDLAHRIEHLVILSVTDVTPLSTPPYDDGADEDEMIALYQAKFAAIYP